MEASAMGLQLSKVWFKAVLTKHFILLIWCSLFQMPYQKPNTGRVNQPVQTRVELLTWPKQWKRDMELILFIVSSIPCYIKNWGKSMFYIWCIWVNVDEICSFNGSRLVGRSLSLLGHGLKVQINDHIQFNWTICKTRWENVCEHSLRAHSRFKFIIPITGASLMTKETEFWYNFIHCKKSSKLKQCSWS